MSKPADGSRHKIALDKIARKLVQIGFLFLFLYPLIPLIYKRVTFKPSPTLTSWALPFDPLLMLGELARRDGTPLVVGGPLLLIAFTLVFGRAFCGWICPLGTLLDLIRPFSPLPRPLSHKARGATRWFPPNANGPLRYYVLIAALVGGAISLQVLGWFDPLVIFHRAATTITANVFALQQPGLRQYISALSFVFLGILALELWQPRFWCRNLCPLGALLSVFSRWPLLNRRVSQSCNACGTCRRECQFNALTQDPHDTDYASCTFCLECENDCPKGGITFGFGALAGKKWQAEGRQVGGDGKPKLAGRYVPAEMGLRVSRRELLGGAAAGAVGLAVSPLAKLADSRGVIRPPGALPETEFLRACIICQECVRVCPTGGLRPTLLEAGLAGIGTPQLIPRQGGCALNPSCPNLCAQVCPVGAIRPTQPQDLKVGLAHVEHSLCLAWDQGVKCLVCVEACLVNAAEACHGRVTVDPEKCTGCGRCESGCPVAGSAIRVYPV